MKHIIAAILLITSTGLNAGSLVITNKFGQAPVSANLTVDAEFVAVRLTIRADHKNPDERIAASETARDSLVKALRGDGLQIQSGIVSLSPQERSSFSFKSYSPNSSVQLYAIGKLDGKNTVFSITRSIYGSASRVELPDDVSISLGTTSLGVDDPEKYREQLLKLIARNIDSTQASLGVKGKVTVSGLDNPVMVIQKNETQVSVYIDHGISIEIESLR